MSNIKQSWPSNIRRLTPDIRKALIIGAAVDLSLKHGLSNWTRRQLADACSVQTSEETIKHYFKTMDEIRRQALASDRATVLLKYQGLAMGFEVDIG